MLALFQYILQKHNSGVRDGLVISLPQMYKDKFEGWNYDAFLKTRDRLKEEGLISIRNDDSYILYNIFDFLGRSERLTDYNPT